MATVTTVTAEKKLIGWHPLWNVLIAVFFLAIVIGVVGDFFIFKGNTILGFKENGTLWNWLQLLSAPVFVTALPLLFKGPRAQADYKADEQQNQADGETSTPQTQNDLKIEENRQQVAALEAYQDHILQLLLDRNLRGSQPGSDVREAARARTLAVLRRVGKNRKGDVLLFLHEAGLIYKGKAIVDLREADLSGADLSNAKLNGIELSGVDLSGATLKRTTLKWADLSNVQLSGADLTGADFSEANLTGADLSGATYTHEQLSSAQPYNQRGIS
jgi:uncharacterized protein YjbI with pentapeptide repeats